MRTLAEQAVAAWSPTIIVSPQVTDRAKVARFAERVRCGYTAPAVGFARVDGVVIAGRHFATVARDTGLLADSVHTLGIHDWHQLFFGIERSRVFPATPDAIPLLCGNSGLASYYHWTLETVATVAMHRRLGFEPVPLIVPTLGEGWMRELLDRFDAPLIEVARDELAVFDGVTTCTLMGRGAGLTPHPAVLAELKATGPEAGIGPEKLYLARLDMPGRRRMENEAELCDLLRARGFAIVNASTLSVAEQAALLRDAALVVAPHGAALTNLVYAADGAAGPRVIELAHEAYLNPVFAKIGQAKRLAYQIVVSPSAGAEPLHRGSWRCDLAALSALLDAG